MALTALLVLGSGAAITHASTTHPSITQSQSTTRQTPADTTPTPQESTLSSPQPATNGTSTTSATGTTSPPTTSCTPDDQHELEVSKQNLDTLQAYAASQGFTNYRMSDQQILNNKINDDLAKGCVLN